MGFSHYCNYCHCCYYCIFYFYFLLSQYFWKDLFETFGNQCDVLMAGFCDSRDVFSRGCVILCVKRLRDFCVLRGCVIFLLILSGCMIYFSRGFLIFFVESLHDFFVKRLHDFFWVERLCDFICSEVA